MNNGTRVRHLTTGRFGTVVDWDAARRYYRVDFGDNIERWFSRADLEASTDASARWTDDEACNHDEMFLVHIAGRIYKCVSCGGHTIPRR